MTFLAEFQCKFKIMDETDQEVPQSVVVIFSVMMSFRDKVLCLLPLSYLLPFLIQDPYLITPYLGPKDAALVFQESHLLRNCYGSSARGEPPVTQAFCVSGTADFRLPCVPSTSHATSHFRNSQNPSPRLPIKLKLCSVQPKHLLVVFWYFPH